VSESTNSSLSKENGDSTEPTSSPQESTAGEGEKKLEALEASVKEKEAKYLYLYADFENFKKRAVKERSDLVKFGWESVARELLQVLDNFDRAIAHAPANADKTFLDGIRMVQGQFQSALEKQGVQPIKTEGESFDPHLHEAVDQAPSDQPAGTILKEETRGYTLHGRLLRPSRVIVSGGS
jgi:molecular chaperone GrpE